MKKLFALVALTGIAFAQGVLVQPFSQADITGTAATVQLVPAGGGARTLLINALTTNTAVARCGDSTVTASRGTPVAAGGALSYGTINTQTNDPQQSLYNLASFYCYIASGDKVAVQWTR